MRPPTSRGGRRALCALALLAPLSCNGIDGRYIQASAETMTTIAYVSAGLYALTATINAFPESRGVMIASHPVGARVLIDGIDSGFSTPCCIAIDERRQRIDLVLDGYETASRMVTDDGRTYLIYWREAYLGTNSYHFPMFLNVYDGWVPVRFEQTYSPERIHVRLRPTNAP